MRLLKRTSARTTALLTVGMFLTLILLSASPTAMACRPNPPFPIPPDLSPLTQAAAMRCQGGGTVTGAAVPTPEGLRLFITFNGAVTAAMNADEAFAGSFAPTLPIDLGRESSTAVQFDFTQRQALVGKSISGTALGAATLRPLGLPTGQAASALTMTLVVPPDSLTINGQRMSLSFTCLVTGVVSGNTFTGTWAIAS